MAFAHRVGVICEGRFIEGWIAYSVSVSMIRPAGTFSLTRAFSDNAWHILRRDAEVTVVIDDTPIITGYIDRRRKVAKAHEFEISGRSKYGRIVQESAPSISYAKLLMSQAIQRLCSPFITKVFSSGALDRSLRRGKGRKVPAGNEPLVIDLPVPNRGRVHQGMTRGAIIADITSQAGYLVWESADGQSVLVGKPHYQQAPQYLVCNARTGSKNRTTVKDLELTEDNGDRYSMIVVAGAGSGDLANYGNNTNSRSARVLDSDLSADGVGRDFLRPKRLMMPERDFDSNNDATRIAEAEMARRDFQRESIVATMPDHGQVITGSSEPTIYTFNTIGRVLDEDFDPPLDENYLTHTVTYDGSRQERTTKLEMVPSGTDIVP